MNVLFDGYGKTVNTNNPVSVVQHNVPLVTEDVSEQKDTISVVTAGVTVQPTKNIPIKTNPAVQEEIEPVVIQTGNTPPVLAGIITDNQETITPVVALDVAPIQEDVEQVDDDSTCSDNTDNSSNYFNAPTGVVDAISLMEMVFPSLVAIVQNLLHTGIAVLASMPKLGKSWFCLLLCIAVATGKEFLGFATNKCEVLYLSFESTFRSLQNRLKMLLQGEEIPKGIHFSTEVKTLDDDLLDFLQQTIDINPKIKLIIVDTFQYIRKKKAKGGTLYNKEYGELGELKQFADKNNVCILLVHHLKNQKTDDVFQQMYGSNGIRGGTDCNMVLTRVKNDEEKVLFSIEGRDIESTSKVIQKDYETCRWEVVSEDIEEDTYRENPIVVTINKMLEENPAGIEITMSEVKDRMYQELEVEYAPQSISREISEHLIPLFMRYDNIRCKRLSPNGGVKGRLWQFYYEKSDTTSEIDI